MLKINKILCIGNNSIDTDTQCRQIATKYDIAYKGMATRQLDDGCYHTSFEDAYYDSILDFSNQADDGMHYGSNSYLKLATQLANRWNHLYAQT